MILDTLLPHADLYVSSHPLFAAGFDYLRRFTPDIADGRYELEGDRLFALVQSYTTVPAAEKRFEAHHRYIDIQFLHSGEEFIGYAPLASLTAADEFNPKKDIGFFHEPAASTPCVLHAGDFAIFFPQDGHKPGCALRGPAAVRKIVLKIAV
jgi:biofilm protein TabA